MAVNEKSFRIGCGRYLQEPGLLERSGEEIRRIGRHPMIIGGQKSLKIVGETLERSVSAACDSYRIIEYAGTCNQEYAQKFAALAHEEGYDVIVGVGGGMKMDFAKLCGFYGNLPVVNIPTSSATCAAYTPHSICYTVEGRTHTTMHHGREVAAVLADTAVIGAQPVRLLLAGVFDALAKFVETKYRFSEGSAEYDMGLDWAYVLSKYSYEMLCKNVQKCIKDMEAGVVSETVERVIFALIAATGVISGVARGAGQSAMAHEFYEKTRILFPEESRPYLHGEIVGVGLLLQNVANGECCENEKLLELMKEFGMPKSVSDVGVENSRENLEKYFELIRTSATVAEQGEKGESDLRAGLEYLWRC